MSIVAASLLGFLIFFLSNVTVNGSLIRLFCQYPNSELCKMHHRLTDLNRYNVVSDLNSRYPIVEEEPFFVNSFDEDTQNLRNQFQGKERNYKQWKINHNFYQTLGFRHLFNNNEELSRCINLGDDSCNNGALPGSGKDDDFLNGNGNPGKRSQSNGLKAERNSFQLDRLRNLRKHIW